MITYCEKVVNKDGEQIQSAYVKYIDDVTAKWYEKETLSVLMDKLRKIQTRAKYSEKEFSIRKRAANGFRWLMVNTYNFEFDFAVIEYLKLKEEDARYVLPTVGG